MTGTMNIGTLTANLKLEAAEMIRSALAAEKAFAGIREEAKESAASLKKADATADAAAGSFRAADKVTRAFEGTLEETAKAADACAISVGSKLRSGVSGASSSISKIHPESAKATIGLREIADAFGDINSSLEPLDMKAGYVFSEVGEGIAKVSMAIGAGGLIGVISGLTVVIGFAAEAWRFFKENADSAAVAALKVANAKKMFDEGVEEKIKKAAGPTEQDIGKLDARYTQQLEVVGSLEDRLGVERQTFKPGELSSQREARIKDFENELEIARQTLVEMRIQLDAATRDLFERGVAANIAADVEEKSKLDIEARKKKEEQQKKDADDFHKIWQEEEKRVRGQREKQQNAVADVEKYIEDNKADKLAEEASRAAVPWLQAQEDLHKRGAEDAKNLLELQKEYKEKRKEELQAGLDTAIGVGSRVMSGDIFGAIGGAAPLAIKAAGRVGDPDSAEWGIIKSATEGLGQFGEMLRVNVGDSLGAITKNAEAFSSVISAAAGFLSKMADEFSKWIDKIIGAFQQIGTGIQDVIQGTVGLAAGKINNAMGMGEVVQPVAQVAGGIATAGGGVAALGGISALSNIAVWLASRLDPVIVSLEILGVTAFGVAGGLVLIGTGMMALAFQTESFKRFSTVLQKTGGMVIAGAEAIFNNMMPLAMIAYYTAQGMQSLIGYMVPGQSAFKELFYVAKNIGLGLINMNIALIIARKNFWGAADAVYQFSKVVGKFVPGFKGLDDPNAHAQWQAADRDLEAATSTRDHLNNLSFAAAQTEGNILAMADAANKATEEMINLPDGYKIARARYDSTAGVSGTGDSYADAMAAANSLSQTNNITINVTTNEPGYLVDRLAKELERRTADLGVLPMNGVAFQSGYSAR